MRNHLSWLIVVALLTCFFISCNSGGNNPTGLGGSDPTIVHFTLGNTPIMVEQTHNIPLSLISTMRFELNRPVTMQSLAQKFNFVIHITNVDTGLTYSISEYNLDENGELVWIEGSNLIIEYRLYHPMDRLLAGGQLYSLGEPGNTLKVEIVFFIAQATDGNQIALTDDTFYIVWTDSHQN